MYFPYFRGRQYELLALKELIKGRLLGRSVTPIVEPIKLSSTFIDTIQAFSAEKSNVGLVFNPAVGEFAKSNNFVNDFFEKFVEIPNCINPTLLMGSNTTKILKALIDKGITQSSLITILDKRDFLDTYKKQLASVMPQFTLFPDEREFRRAVSRGKVMFKDNFNKQVKNAKYPEDEFYTEDHLFYKDEGYDGFGDYSIIGNEYTESGFAPYAVAIHIVYFDKDNKLRVRHFVSNSNEDISDVAGKFSEAVGKLAMWYKNGQQWQLTSALATLLSHAEKGYYPGLPTIKKLSIMHHLELVGRYLDGELSK